MKTYKYEIDGKELVVTDSLIVAEEFGLRHDNILRTIKRIENLKIDALTSEDIYFARIDYKDAYNRTKPKYVISEYAFYKLLMNIKGGSKLGVKKLDAVQDEFILEFKRLRDQNSKLANLGRIFIEYFAPIDEIGMLSIFNGKLRLFTRRACLTTEKNARPFPTEDQQALIDGMSMIELRDISARTIVRHAKDKKATNAKRYVPSFLYKYFNERGWLTNKVPYNPTLNLF
jgi:Rha family phage regulatory protein